MTFIDGTVVNVALPVLQREFRASVAEAQWIVEAYALMLAALILVGGSLGDRPGPGASSRPVFCSLLSLLCGAGWLRTSPSSSWRAECKGWALNAFHSSLAQRLRTLPVSSQVRGQLLQQSGDLVNLRIPAGISGETRAAIREAVRESFVSCLSSSKRGWRYCGSPWRTRSRRSGGLPPRPERF